MPTYVLLSTLTSEGGMTVHQNPDRIAAVNDEITAFGCKVTAQYALLGQYDFLTVVDAPDNETIAHLSVDLGSRGTTKITTLPAIPLDKLVEKLKAPEQIGRAGHQPPTSTDAEPTPVEHVATSPRGSRSSSTSSSSPDRPRAHSSFTSASSLA